MTSLMDLSMDVDNAFAMVLEAETEEQKAAAEAKLTSLLSAQSDKVSAVALVLNRFTRDANNLRAEADLLVAGAEKIEAEEKRLRSYIKRVMELTGTQQMKSPLATFSLASGVESVDVMYEDMVPNEYRLNPTVPPPDKKAIREALKRGETVPGCRLNGGETVLKIRYAKSSADVLDPDRNTLTEGKD